MLVIPNLNNWRKELSETALAALNQLVTVKKVCKGQYIYSLGEASKNSYQIKSGRVNICIYSKDGDGVILTNLYPGDCFGEMGLITGQNRVNYAVASEDSEINVLSRDNYELICLKHPEILVSINKMLCNRLRLAFETIEDVYLLPLCQRVAKALIRLALSDGEPDGENGIVVNNISQEKLGLMVGATRQSIARELKLLEKEKMLSLKYNKLTIPNFDNMINKFEDAFSLENMISTYRDDK